jgi:hypothetical protein
MKEAETSLRQGKTGGQVTDAQDAAIRQLDALIAACQVEPGAGMKAGAAEGGSPSAQPTATTALPMRPAQESVLPSGGPSAGPVRPAGELVGAWLPQLPPTEQKKVADTFTAGRLPSRYRNLLRLYNRRLAEGEGTGR